MSSAFIWYGTCMLVFFYILKLKPFIHLTCYGSTWGINFPYMGEKNEVINGGTIQGW